MASEIHHKIEGTVQTTGSTAITVTTFTLPDECVAMVIAKVVGRKASPVDAWPGFVQTAVFRRTAAGAATIVGAVDTDYSAGILTSTINATSNDVRVQVTGELATTYDWLCIMEIVLYVP